MRLSFNGAAGNVTGSCYLLDTDEGRFLVDCGLHQERQFVSRNWDHFPFDPASLNAVLLTHAHLDHCGLLPRLVKAGFDGRIVCTAATADIAGIVLLDSARIQEEDVDFKRERHRKAGRVGPHPYDPLYTVADAEAVLSMFNPVDYETAVSLGGKTECVFRDAGHILGSASIKVTGGSGSGRRSVVFSGDIGRPHTPILRDPAPFDKTDYLVIESTYGNRIHKPSSGIPTALSGVINRTYRAGGNVVVPSFAVERSQELLFHLHELLRAKRIPPLTVFLDSPMAVNVTEVFRRHPELFDEETAAMLRRGEHPCDFPHLRLCRSVEDSLAVRSHNQPAVIIAGSGMCTGGRIKRHLQANIERRESTILFVGYQASGTLGRLILEGAERVRIYGKSYLVEANVQKVNGFSAHADRNELLAWASALKQPPELVFVTHGEPEASAEFAAELGRRNNWRTSVPAFGDVRTLG
jgi:metallo-beta-lactamase family protein